MLCPICNNNLEFKRSSDVYFNRPDLSNKFMYICFRCDVRCAARENGRLIGTPANKKLREMRRACHGLFDVRWKSGSSSRTKCYQWLQKVMRLSEKEAHIGLFTEEQCTKLLQILTKNEVVKRVNAE